MTRFLFIYHSPTNPSVDEKPADVDMGGEMDAWMQWGARVGEQLTDFGAPLANGVTVSPDGGTAPSTREVTGYSFIEADSMDAVLEFAKNHPHLKMPGSTIEVHEVQPVPGM